MSASLKIGYCITAHGYGHAARSAAVMEALSGQADVHFTIATMVPEWFFRSSLSGSFSICSVQADAGLVQHSVFEEDLPATVEQLEAFYPFRREMLDNLASTFARCDLVLCDIAPAGIAAARKAKIPSVLVENFTWDWIYDGYVTAYPRLKPVIEYVREVYSRADFHIQAEPVCAVSSCDVHAAPVARRIKSPENVRRLLEVDEKQRLVLVSMGGEGISRIPLDLLDSMSDIVFVVPGAGIDGDKPDNIRALEKHSGFFHPDLVAACDAVVGKAGYSTLAEVYHADVPFGYIRRLSFPESGPLVRYIEQNMRGMEIAMDEWSSGQWVERLPELLAMGRGGAVRSNGADQCAAFILSLFHR